jgi:long-chain fatty acid transport protein
VSASGTSVAIAVAVAVLASSSAAHASPEDLFGFGPRSPAMGETGAACSAGADAAYTNPALLARVRRDMLTVGFSGATFDLHADGAGLPGRVSVRPAKGVVFGAEVPIPFAGVLQDRVAVGLAFYTPTDVLVRGRILYPEAAEFPLLADRAQSLAVRMAVGVDLGHGLRVGAGFAALAELVGTIAVVGGAGTAGAHVDDQLVATYAPTLGVSYDLPFALRAGLTYRAPLEARFAVQVDASKLSTLDIPVLNIAGVAQYDPAEIAVEVAREADGWVLAAGATYKRWSAYPGPFEATLACPAGEDCQALTPPRVQFSDTIVPRVGAERAIAAGRAVVRLRAGFFVEPTPVPSVLPSSQAYDAASQRLIDVPTRLFDATRYVATLGAGVDLGELAPLTLDTWVQLHWLAPATVDTPPAPSASLSGTALAWGLLLGARF